MLKLTLTVNLFLKKKHSETVDRSKKFKDEPLRNS